MNSFKRTTIALAILLVAAIVLTGVATIAWRVMEFVVTGGGAW